MTRRTTNHPIASDIVTDRRAIGIAAAVCLALAVLAGGCEGGTLVSIENSEDFQRQVIEADGPVLVEFYKTACPTCVMQEDVLGGLAREYQGRVQFAKFLIKDLSWSSTAPAIQDRYDLFWVPTAILFVDGEERQRWELNHGAWEFRRALNEAAGAPASASLAEAQASAAPSSPPPPPLPPYVAQWPNAASDDGCIDGLGCPINRTPHGEPQIAPPLPSGPSGG